MFETIIKQEERILINKSSGSIMKVVRSGNKDIWNAFMANGAAFSKFDIPFCPTTATTIPSCIITWKEALVIHRKKIKQGEQKYFVNSFVCFYLDDYKFDNRSGIWAKPNQALKILVHFAGVITPDFSTYQDFPEPIKIYATYRMRLFGFWLGKNNVAVINNVRWGTEESWRYCFEGIPSHSIVSIGTVGGSPYKKCDRNRFEHGFNKMIEVLKPHTIIVYGSANYPCFKQLNSMGIKVIAFPSSTSLYYKKGGKA